MDREYPPDEISLIHLYVILHRRRKFVLGVTLTFLVAGVVVALLKAPDYRFTTPLIPATTVVERQGSTGVQPIENPADLVARLNDAIIPEALRTIARRQAISLEQLPRVMATAPQNGARQMLLTTTESADRTPQVQAVHKEIIRRLQESQAPLISNDRSRFQARLERAELKLAQLKDPVVFAADKTAQKQLVDQADLALQELPDNHTAKQKTLEAQFVAARGQIKSFKDQQTLLDRRLKQEKSAEASTRDEIAKVRQTIAASETDLRQDSRSTNGSAATLNQVLAGNQLQQYWQRLSDLEQRLNTTLPAQADDIDKQRAALDTELAAMQAQLVDLESQRAQLAADYKTQEQSLKGQLQQQQAVYDKLVADHQHAIKIQEQQVIELKSTLEQVQPARAIGIAVQSDRPTGLGRSVIVILCTLLGVLIGIFGAFSAEVLAKAKAEMAGL